MAIKQHWTLFEPQLVEASEAVSNATSMEEAAKANNRWKRIYQTLKEKYDAVNQSFVESAIAYGVNATYSPRFNTMQIAGDDTKVKSFIRLCCLKGKEYYPFNIKKATNK